MQQLEQTYPTNTQQEKQAVVTEAIEQIESNPSLKARVVRALKAGSIEAFKELIKHPLVNYPYSKFRRLERRQVIILFVEETNLSFGAIR